MSELLGKILSRNSMNTSYKRDFAKDAGGVDEVK